MNLTFKDKLDVFIQSRSHLFTGKSAIQTVPKATHDVKTIFTATGIDQMPPLEKFLDISAEFLEKHFYKSVRIGDTFIGQIISLQENGLLVQMCALETGIKRDMSAFKIMAFIPVREVPQEGKSDSPLESYQMRDFVRGIILDTDFHDRTMLASMKPKSPGGLTLGIIPEEELPLFIRTPGTSKSFEESLQNLPQVNNQGSLGMLCEKLHISFTDCLNSLLFSVLHSKQKRLETAEELTQIQMVEVAQAQVAKGIIFFKENRNTEALQCYNHALKISGEKCVDAFVARGALYASLGNYRKAQEDLQKALDMNPRHNNARNYFAQTLYAQGQELLKEGKKKEAEEKFRVSLSYDPQLHESMQALKSMYEKVPAETRKVMLKSELTSMKDTSSSGYMGMPSIGVIKRESNPSTWDDEEMMDLRRVNARRQQRSPSGSPFHGASAAFNQKYNQQQSTSMSSGSGLGNSGRGPGDGSPDLNWAKNKLLGLMEKDRENRGKQMMNERMREEHLQKANKRKFDANEERIVKRKTAPDFPSKMPQGQRNVSHVFDSGSDEEVDPRMPNRMRTVPDNVLDDGKLPLRTRPNLFIPPSARLGNCITPQLKQPPEKINFSWHQQKVRPGLVPPNTKGATSNVPEATTDRHPQAIVNEVKDIQRRISENVAAIERRHQVSPRRDMTGRNISRLQLTSPPRTQDRIPMINNRRPSENMKLVRGKGPGGNARRSPDRRSPLRRNAGLTARVRIPSPRRSYRRPERRSISRDRSDSRSSRGSPPRRDSFLPRGRWNSRSRERTSPERNRRPSKSPPRNNRTLDVQPKTTNPPPTAPNEQPTTVISDPNSTEKRSVMDTNLMVTYENQQPVAIEEFVRQLKEKKETLKRQT